MYTFGTKTFYMSYENKFPWFLVTECMTLFFPDIFTARKRSLGQGYIFTGICHSVNRGGLPQCMLGYTPSARETPPAKKTPSRETPLPGRPPSARETPCQGDPPPKRPAPLPRRPPSRPTPRGKLRGFRSRPIAKGELRGIRSRPTPKGEIEGDQIQAHTQGGNWGGSDPSPHPREKLRGIRSRPTPKGGIQGIRTRTPPHEDYCCILVFYIFLFATRWKQTFNEYILIY